MLSKKKYPKKIISYIQNLHNALLLVINEYKEKKSAFAANSLILHRNRIVSFSMEKNSVLKGDLNVLGNALIGGTFVGNVNIGGMVIVTEDAVIKGHIYAKGAEICGRIEGDLIIDGKLSLFSTAQVFGNIYARDFDADDSSIVEGTVNIICDDMINIENESLFDNGKAYLIENSRAIGLSVERDNCDNIRDNNIRDDIEETQTPIKEETVDAEELQIVLEKEGVYVEEKDETGDEISSLEEEQSEIREDADRDGEPQKEIKDDQKNKKSASIDEEDSMKKGYIIMDFND